MYTFQDFEAVPDYERPDFIRKTIRSHQASEAYRVAVDADEYDAQRNVTISTYVKQIFSISGAPMEDFTASNSRICSNFFHRLNTQRVMYSLGNGVSFLQPDEEGEDAVKQSLGPTFDFDLAQAALKACEHGVSFLYWNLDRMYWFPITEFAPLWDERTGQLRAGVRFWRLDADHPMVAVLYEEDGYTRYETREDSRDELVEAEPKRAYVTNYTWTPADGRAEVVGFSNYGSLPIVPMWGNRLRQSTLVGMREAIDSYDLIRSGFANDLTDCSEIYWLVENAGGMSDQDLARFRDRLKLTHIAPVDSDAGSSVRPYTQDIPYAARQAYLADIRSEIYESFGALDVHAVAAGATNDHIDAAYQPMDENAADFEHWVGEAVHQILLLQGVDDMPIFKRNRISNQAEQVQMVVQEAEWLDHATILRKLPNVTPEEASAILAGIEAEDLARMGFGGAPRASEGISGDQE